MDISTPLTLRAAMLVSAVFVAASFAGAATIPLTNDFSTSGLDANSGFTLGSGFQTLTATGAVTPVGYSTSQFSNAANTSFTLTSQFRVTSIGNAGGSSQGVGFGFFATDATFAGAAATPYLFANYSISLGTLSIIEVDGSNTNLQSGTPSADLNGGTAGFVSAGATLYTLRLDITNIATDTYSISFGVFDAAGTSQFGTSATIASYSVNSATSSTALNANGFYGIRARLPNTSGTTTVGFDNFDISLAAVPEPSTYAVFTGFAVFGLAAYRRRRA